MGEEGEAPRLQFAAPVDRAGAEESRGVDLINEGLGAGVAHHLPESIGRVGSAQCNRGNLQSIEN